MSFATALPYALIVDGPRAVRWWGKDGEGAKAWAGGAAAAAVDGGADGGSDDAGARAYDNDDGAATTLASLALYLVVSGILLFLHSAVR